MSQTKPLGKAKKTKKGSLAVVILDDRVRSMPTNVLNCRGRLHRWDEVPTESTRRAELAALLQIQVDEICSSCKSKRITVFDIHGSYVKRPTISYDPDFDVPAEFKGTGRIPKQESRAAWIASKYSDLVKVAA
jgi:hypothetical protein